MYSSLAKWLQEFTSPHKTTFILNYHKGIGDKKVMPYLAIRKINLLASGSKLGFAKLP